MSNYQGQTMRWRFNDVNNQEEMAERNEVLARIDAWWSAFRLQTDQLHAIFTGKADWDLPEWMATHLQAIHPELMWEFGSAVRGEGHRLVITPESRHVLRPLVSALLERAPEIAGWEFYAYRLPENHLSDALATVEGRTGRDISDFQVEVRAGDQQQLDLCYLSPSISGENDENAFHAALVATETFLGEQMLNEWIGSIEVRPLRKGLLKTLFKVGTAKSATAIPLDQMKLAVEAIISGMREQLPAEPHLVWVKDAKWNLWQLSPEAADDFTEQQDLIVGKSPNPAMWVAAHNGKMFFSKRYSRCGETFCYVKIDGSEGLDNEHFADKGEIEDALDALLEPAGLGSTIGGGSGLRYAYIDLALVDLERGIEAVCERLRQGNAPKRSWIQFFDSDLAAEWVGIYEDSPPPPMPED